MTPGLGTIPSSERVYFSARCAGTTFEGGKGENAPTLPPPHPGVAIDTQTPMSTGI